MTLASMRCTQAEVWWQRCTAHAHVCTAVQGEQGLQRVQCKVTYLLASCSRACLAGGSIRQCPQELSQQCHTCYTLPLHP